MDKLDQIEKEKKVVLDGEKPLIECKKPSDLSKRQMDLYIQFRAEIRNRCFNKENNNYGNSASD